MKKYFLLSLLIISTITIAQNKTATTEDGKKVLLKSDKTWQYAETENISDNSKQNISKSKVFIEPKGENKNQSFLKKATATVADMKRHVSVDTGCPVDKILLKDLSEQLGNAIYVLEVCNISMKYRRSGSVFFKDGDEIFKTK
jgi:type III secretory pathway component EscV